MYTFLLPKITGYRETLAAFVRDGKEIPAADRRYVRLWRRAMPRRVKNRIRRTRSGSSDNKCEEELP